MQNIEVALIGIYALESLPTISEINSVFKYASERSDFQIAYVHWGLEYELNSSKSQRILAKTLVDSGADIIVGHHPHVVQEISEINGVPVFYSLGNYIFDQYSTNDVQQGLILNIEFSYEPAIHLIPVTSQYSLSQPKHMDDLAKQKFLLNLANRSNAELRGEIESGTLYLPKLVATSSKVAIINR